MWTLLIALTAAQDPMPLAEARELESQLDTPDWHAHWLAFLDRLDAVAPPEDGPTPANHEAVAALAYSAEAIDARDLDTARIDDGIRAQLVRRTPLRRDYDAQSIEAGATYREGLSEAVLVLGRDPRSLCIELRAVRARYEAGDAEEAVQTARSAISAYTHPYDVAVSEHLVGQLLLKQGDTAAAREHLERALAVYDPDARDQPHAPTLDRAVLYADLIATYDALGQDKPAKKARKQLKKAIKLGPSDSLWEQDQDRLEVRLGEPYQGTCWEGDAWWAMVASGERPGLDTSEDSP